jgi:hypothetical protein
MRLQSVQFSSLVFRKKDYSTAILEKKKAPNKLQVEDSPQDDNSVCELTQAKMDELKIFQGDAVILRGKQRFSQPRIAPNQHFLFDRQEEKGDFVHCFG